MSEMNALSKSNLLIEPADDYKLLLKWDEGKRIISLAKVIDKSERFFSQRKAEKLGVSFDPYLLFNLSNNEVSICGCSNEGVCPLPDISPVEDGNRSLLSFQAHQVGPSKFGIKVGCLRKAVQENFGIENERSVCLWLNIPPNVLAQLAL